MASKTSTSEPTQDIQDDNESGPSVKVSRRNSNASDKEENTVAVPKASSTQEPKSPQDEGESQKKVSDGKRSSVASSGGGGKRASISSEKGSRRGSIGRGGRRKNSLKANQDGYKSKEDESGKQGKVAISEEMQEEAYEGARTEDETEDSTAKSPKRTLGGRGTTAASALTVTSSAFDTEFDHDDEDVGTDPFKIPDDTSFENMQDVYNGVLRGLQCTDQHGVNISLITDEFAHLWEGIQRSHENEVHLIEADRDISVKLSAAMARCRNFIKLAEDDPKFAIKLGQQLERAWDLADIGDEKEKENQDTIDTLRVEVMELNRNINTAMRIEGQGTLRELQALKKDLEKQRDAVNAEANKYRSTLNDLFAKRQELFDKKSALEEKEQLLDQEWEAQLDATDRETTRRERLAEETAEVNEKLGEKSAQLEDVEKTLHHVDLKLIDTDKAVKEQKAVNDHADRDAEFSYQRIEKLRADVESRMANVEKLTIEAYRTQQELRIRESEIALLRRELARGMRQKTFVLKKNVMLRQGMAALEIEREQLKSKVATLEKDLDRAQKELEQNKKRVDALDKQRTVLNRHLKRAAILTSEHETQTVQHQGAVVNVEATLHVYHGEISFQRHQIERLESERDFFSLEATKFAQQVVYRLIEIKKLDAAVLQYRKKIAGLDSDLKKIQQIYHIAESDKMMFERTLRDAITEIKDNFTRIKLMRNQVATLKNQVNQKDEIIHQEALRYDRIIKETDFFTKHATRVHRLAEDLLRQVEALQLERSSVSCSAAEFHGELSKNAYYANTAESRRRVYQRRAMECERELREVWEKWRVLHSSIRISAYHYRNILRHIKVRRCDILERRKVQADIVQKTKNYSQLRREVAVMENCIAKEKCMINAVEVQTQHPINVHRWRLLEVMNPDAYEMVVKINLLTKRLVDRNAELQRLSGDLKEKQTMYVEVRKCLERSPGLELGEEIIYYQNLIVAKKHQYECLRHDLRTAESQVAHYRQQVKDLHDKMMQLKQMYFKRLRAEAEKKELFPISCPPNPNDKMTKRYSPKPGELVPEDFDFASVEA